MVYFQFVVYDDQCNLFGMFFGELEVVVICIDVIGEFDDMNILSIFFLQWFQKSQQFILFFYFYFVFIEGEENGMGVFYKFFMWQWFGYSWQCILFNSWSSIRYIKGGME